MTNDRARGSIAWMARNPVAANLLMLFFLIGGLYVIPGIKQEVFPAFELDYVNISVPYPGATPEEIEKGILLVIEEEIRTIDGIKKVTSTASEGSGRVSAELYAGGDRSRILQDIKNAVDRISSFPEEIESPIVSLAENRRRIVSLIIYGDIGEAHLRMLADMARDELTQDPDISLVELDGVRAPEIGIQIPTETLRSYNLTLDDVANLIARNAVELSAGGIETSYGEILLRTDERRDYGSEFIDLPVITRPDGTRITLGDLARIEDGLADTDKALFFHGKQAAELEVFQTADENPVDISKAVKRYAEELEARLPPTVHTVVWADRSEIYYERIQLLLRNAGIGLCLVMLILGLFLEVRLAFWVMLGIPVSFLGCLTLLPSLDVSVNMISLFAFIVALGIVVDDAIVVGENVYRLRQEGLPPMKAAAIGAQQIAVPVVFSILTNIAAVAPLLFVPGVAGKIWRNIPLIIISVFTISLVEALYILPAHLGHMRTAKKTGLWRILEGPQKFFGQGLDRFIQRAYTPFLHGAVRNRYAVLLVALTALALTFGWIRGGRMKFIFLPKVESDRVNVDLVMPYGTPAESTFDIAEHMRKAAEQTVASFGANRYVRGLLVQVGRAGGGGPMGGGSSSGSHLARVRVHLVPTKERPFSARQFTERWRKAIGPVSGAESVTFDFTIGPGGSRPIDVQLSHPDPEIIEECAMRTAAALGNFEGVVELDDGVAQGKSQLNYKIKPAAQTLGLTAAELARQLRHAFYGAEAARQQRGRDEIKIMVRLPKNERETEYTVENLMIQLPNGGEMPLKEAATVERGRAYDIIRRSEGRRVLNVTADLTPSAPDARRILEGLDGGILRRLQQQYPALRYSFEGERRDIRESFSALGKGFIVAVIVIYALIAIPFNSWIQALIILSAIPFGFVGAVVGHLIMGYNLSFVSMMGIVALSGVVVNDSLILIDTANRMRREGMNPYKAIVHAAPQRFRPILLTSITTFGGLAPMIFETSVQARFMIPMAVSLGFGIIFSTTIALLIVPALYLMVEDVRRLILRPVRRSSDS